MVFEDFTHEAPAFPFYFRQFLAGQHDNFHYVIGDPQSREAVVVDPAFHLGPLWAAVAKDHVRITRALFTHGHGDHIGGIPEIFGFSVEQIAIHESARDQPKVQEAVDAGRGVRLLENGDVLYIGRIPIQAIHTPGHQPESTCYLVGEPGGPQALLGGDCLFVDSCGRTDFPGGDTDLMYESMQRIRALQGDITLFPGHHYATRPHRPLREQLEENPALATTEPKEFSRLPFLKG